MSDKTCERCKRIIPDGMSCNGLGAGGQSFDIKWICGDCFDEIHEYYPPLSYLADAWRVEREGIWG